MNESCYWICLACVPARHLLKLGLLPRHAALAQSRPICISTTTEPHGAGSYSTDTNSKKNQSLSLPGFLHQQGGDAAAIRRGPTLQFRHQLLPQPHPPPPYPILTNTTTTPLLLLPMPLSSAAPLTSLASIWIEAPCFSSYKSR